MPCKGYSQETNERMVKVSRFKPYFGSQGLIERLMSFGWKGMAALNALCRNGFSQF